MSNKTFLFVFAVLMLFGCRNNKPVSEMCFDDISYITDFPKNFTLDNGDVLDVTKIGIRDILLYDTLMFVSSPDANGLISVFVLPECREIGSYFSKGNGPGEILDIPFFTNFCIDKKDGRTDVLFDDGKGNLLKWDISSLSASCRPHVSVLIDSLPTTTFYNVYVNDSTLLHRDIKADGSGQKRYMTINGKKHVTSSMKSLNSASIPVKGDGYLFNIMSSFVKYDRKHNMVVEASLMLNTINMYTLDGIYEKTLCIGKKADNIDRICRYGMLKLKETFIKLRIYGDFYAVMYSGGGMITGSAPLPKIYLFGWDGIPIAQINLKEMASCFDFDCTNGLLYTLDRDSEIIRKYNISHLGITNN